MATGLSNKLIGQVGEFLVCAELGRRGLIATPFSGNVPGFDVIATNDRFCSVPIQVKTSNGGDWRFDARKLLAIAYDKATGIQRVEGKIDLADPSTIYVFVQLRSSKAEMDRFFVTTRAEVQDVAHQHYTTYLKKHNGRRPQRSDSFYMAIRMHELSAFEDNWPLLAERLAS